MEKTLQLSIGFALLVVVISQYYSDYSDVSNSDKRSGFGDACQCCYSTRNRWCCTACGNQGRSMTPFYNKRGVDNTYTLVDRRSRYMASSCTCCTLKRNPWCCRQCRRLSTRFGKRSGGEQWSDQPYSMNEDIPSSSAFTDFDDDYENEYKTEPFPMKYDNAVQPSIPVDNQNAVASSTFRIDCLCCVAYGFTQCCDRCKAVN